MEQNRFTPEETEALIYLVKAVFRIEDTLRLITHKLSHMEKKAQKASADNDQILADLTQKVADNTSVEQSAVQTLTGLKAALDAAIASGDLSQVQALSDQLGQNNAALAAAITANTPAAA